MKLMITVPINISLEHLKQYIELGVDVIRFNFSHIDLELFEKLYFYVKNNYPDIKILQDLQGEKIRIHQHYIHDIKIDKGRKICFCDEEYYKKHAYKVPYALLPINWEHDFKDLFLAKKIIIGSTEIKKESLLNDSAIIGVAEEDFVIRADKGINFVDINRQQLSLTKKDIEDLDFIKDYSTDYICISFVENKSILKDIKEKIQDYSFRPKIIAKIETLTGCKNIKEILTECDGIMLGRGDLSKELEPIEFIKQQANIINIAKENCKEIIVGTYAMCSMLYSERPSVSDLTSLQYLKDKNIDCLMLSDEIVIGKYAKQTIELVNRIIK